MGTRGVAAKIYSPLMIYLLSVNLPPGVNFLVKIKHHGAGLKLACQPFYFVLFIAWGLMFLRYTSVCVSFFIFAGFMKGRCPGISYSALGREGNRSRM